MFVKSWHLFGGANSVAQHVVVVSTTIPFGMSFSLPSLTVRSSVLFPLINARPKKGWFLASY